MSFYIHEHLSFSQVDKQVYDKLNEGMERLDKSIKVVRANMPGIKKDIEKVMPHNTTLFMLMHP